MRRLPSSLAILSAALLAGASPLAAQHLRLRVVEAETGRPLAGALVEVLDSANVLAAQVVLSATGERQLRLPVPGLYHARLRRIGYQPFVGPAIRVTTGDVADQLLQAPARRVTLAAVDVTAPARCSRDAFSDPAFAELWDVVRTALTTTTLGRQGAGLVAETRNFRRRLDVRREPVSLHVGLPRVTSAERPYVARSADSLSRLGYMEMGGASGTVFFAPDEQVLLSDAFLRDHCFTLARGGGDNEGELGVRFAPARRSDVTGIAGTIWVDSASAELRRVEFFYELPKFPVSVVGPGRTGGEILFGRTPAGLWVVSAWRLRMPHFSSAKSVSVETEPDWWTEMGGVLTPPPGDTTTLQRALVQYREMLVPARVTGTIHDSLAGAPLRSAHVWLLPARAPDEPDLEGPGRLAVVPRFATTDASGAYTLDSIPAGTYRLVVDHAGLDSLGVPLPNVGIRLEPGVEVRGTLATPSLRTLQEGCMSPSGPVHGGTSQGLLLGVVRAAGDQRPIEGALVRIGWNDLAAVRLSLANVSRAVETRSDSLGQFRVCGIPEGAAVSVRAAGEKTSTGAVHLDMGDAHISRVALRLPDVAAGEQEPARATIIGTLADSAGIRTPGATVQVEGTGLETRTDSTGSFRISGVPPGTQTIDVRRPGMSPIYMALDLEPAGTTQVTLVAQRARLLERQTILAAAEGQSPFLQDAISRHRFGSGYLRMADWLAERGSLQSAIQAFPNVRMFEGRDRTPFQNDGLIVWMSSSRGTSCQARIYLDMMEIGLDQQSTVNLDHLAAMEVYRSPAFAPIFTMGKSYHHDDDCGVVIMWSKR